MTIAAGYYSRAAQKMTGRNNKSTIVIVDDQAVNRTIYAKIACSIADDVWTRTFEDSREALEALVGIAPDLIITDYQMPGVNGASFMNPSISIFGFVSGGVERK